MANEVTKIYKTHFLEFSDKTKRGYKEDKTLLNFPNLKTVKNYQKSRKIWEYKKCVVIAGSGMVTGGRVIGHLRKVLPDPGSSVVFVGFQAEGTPGRTIIDGTEEMNFFGDDIKIRAKIYTINGFSAHADQKDLVDWVSQVDKVEKVFITHGESESKKTLRQKIQDELPNVEIIIPEPNNCFEL